jgi:uncharacterized phage-associated protein
VTGLDYQAWKFGPVPTEVMQEWEAPEPDLAAAIAIRPEKVIDYVCQTVVPLVAFDDRHFTKRQLRIMGELADRHRDTRSPGMIDVTHAENGAWATVWQDGSGMNQGIPYKLGLEPDSPLHDAVLEVVREQAAIRQTYRSHP